MRYYRFQPMAEIVWAALVAAVVVLAGIMAETDVGAIDDWTLWVTAAAAAAARAALAAAQNALVAYFARSD